MNELTGADFKSATADDNKVVYRDLWLPDERGRQWGDCSVMQMAGYSVAETLEEADAVFMNTCSIRDNASRRFWTALEFFHSLKKKKGPDCRCTGMYGGTGEGWSDNEPSCRSGGSVRMLTWRCRIWLPR